MPKLSMKYVRFLIFEESIKELMIHKLHSIHDKKIRKKEKKINITPIILIVTVHLFRLTPVG